MNVIDRSFTLFREKGALISDLNPARRAARQVRRVTAGSS
jgi:hypothetical protein